MAGTNDEVVKDVEVVHIEGKDTDEKDDETTEDTESDSTTENEGEGEEETSEEEDTSKKPDEIIQNKKPTEDAGEESGDQDDDGLEDVEGETPRERALRKELTKTRKQLRGERSEEILGKPEKKAPAQRKELSDQEKGVLGKYKPEELAALREVLPVLAKEQGYVRQDELVQETYASQAQTHLDSFLDKHKEYLPENDKDGKLWDAFKTEFALYKAPTDPKDFQKIFNKVHKDVFGIKAASTALPKVNAQQEKKQVASHAGTSKPNTPRERTTGASSGFRTDMLKGFSDEEKSEMFGED